MDWETLDLKAVGVRTRCAVRKVRVDKDCFGTEVKQRWACLSKGRGMTDCMFVLGGMAD